LAFDRLKILLILGTRPEAIKMAPVLNLLNSTPNVVAKLCVSAQQRQMLDQVLDVFGIVPDFDLDLMREKQSLTDIVAGVMQGLEIILKNESPDIVLVHGDTSTSFAASLAAFYQKIPVGHVEAGLRTGNLYSPWPEEMNRRLTGVIATKHFAPTLSAQRNLLKEGVDEGSITVTGNTVIDALLSIVEKIDSDTQLTQKLKKQFNYLDENRNLILGTGHRRENFGQGFENICHALREIAEHDDVEVVYPVHLNPNVQEPVRRLLSQNSNIHLIEPLTYLPFVYLMKRSHIILTDSGGIQEEAPSLGKPVLVLRDTTERPEALDAGTIKLVGTDKEKIVNETKKLLDDERIYEQMARAHNPFGDGKAAEKIVKKLVE